MLKPTAISYQKARQPVSRLKRTPVEGGGKDISRKEERTIMKIYVGNLAYDVTEDELVAKFGAYGKVESVAIPSDKISGRPKGFAFVEMSSKSEAEAAITGLSGKTLKDRTIVVNESRPRPDNRGGGSYGNRSGGGYGGGRGGYSGGNRRRY
jgi:cold-inducible RNA-binding protein